MAEPLQRRGVVSDVRATTGRSGALRFVTVDYEVAGGQGALADRQELVYRPAATRTGATRTGATRTGATKPSAPPRSGSGPDDRAWTWGIDLPVDPTLLFRFSALTYNAHRIHYDRAWATGVEGYPGLVVHGPLQAVGLAELCRRHVPGRLRQFRFRAVSPAFDDGPLLLRGRPGDEAGTVVLGAFDHRGTTTMTATGAVA